MRTLTTRHSMITCLIVFALSAVALYAVDRYGRDNRIFGRSGTIQAGLVSKYRVASPVDAYRIWKQAGYRGRTIVIVSDRWDSFDPGELIPVEMFRAYPLQLYNTARVLENSNLNGVTFLYVASWNRICRKIVAIVPEDELNRIKEAARRSKDARIATNGVFVARQGYPRWFVTAAGFDASGEPALLYVGASYFTTAEPEDLYRKLSASGLLTDCVILCNEEGKGSVTPREISRLNRFARLMGMTPPSAGSSTMTPPVTRNQHRAVPAS